MVPSPENLVINCLKAVGHFEITTGGILTDIYATLVDFAHKNFILSPLVDVIVKRQMLDFMKNKKQ